MKIYLLYTLVTLGPPRVECLPQYLVITGNPCTQVSMVNTTGKKPWGLYMTDMLMAVVQQAIIHLKAEAILENPDGGLLWDTMPDGSPWRKVGGMGGEEGRSGLCG